MALKPHLDTPLINYTFEIDTEFIGFESLIIKIVEEYRYMISHLPVFGNNSSQATPENIKDLYEALQNQTQDIKKNIESFIFSFGDIMKKYNFINAQKIPETALIKIFATQLIELDPCMKIYREAFENLLNVEKHNYNSEDRIQETFQATGIPHHFFNKNNSIIDVNRANTSIENYHPVIERFSFRKNEKDYFQEEEYVYDSNIDLTGNTLLVSLSVGRNKQEKIHFKTWEDGYVFVRDLLHKNFPRGI